jgi:hypothetical protein
MVRVASCILGDNFDADPLHAFENGEGLRKRSLWAREHMIDDQYDKKVAVEKDIDSISRA